MSGLRGRHLLVTASRFQLRRFDSDDAAAAFFFSTLLVSLVSQRAETNRAIVANEIPGGFCGSWWSAAATRDSAVWTFEVRRRAGLTGAADAALNVYANDEGF